MLLLVGITRFSSEVRTVETYDVAEGIGAENIDGTGEGQQLQLFRCMDSNGVKNGNGNGGPGNGGTLIDHERLDHLVGKLNSFQKPNFKQSV